MSKKSKSKRIPENTPENRIKLLKQRGFKLDPYEGKWYFKDQCIEEPLVFDLDISFSDFEKIVNKISPSVPIQIPSQWWSPTSPSSSKSNFPYSDAMDFRLPGSYGTGKRR